MRSNEDIGIHNLLSKHESSQDEYQKLLYTVSHDLAAPMRSIVSFSKLLKQSAEAKLEEKELHYLGFIIDNGEKVQQMFLSLLEHSRLQTRALEHERIDSAEIMQSTLELLAVKIKAADAKVIVDELPSVYAEPNHLARLFFVLIDNAIKFRRNMSRPQIRVSAERYGKGYKFIIADDGIGIEQRHHSHIFDVFRRLHSDKEYPGIGMGLALAKRIMELHDGDIWVKSSPDKGSEFYLFFPDYNSSDKK